MRKAIMAGIMLASCLGCEREPKAEDAVPLDQVPPAAIKAAEKALPGVKFENAWKDGDTFEIRGKAKGGKLKDAKVTTEGKVLEVD